VNLVFLFTYLVRPPEFIKVVLVLPRGLFLYGVGIWFVEVCALCLQRSRHLAPMPPFSSYFWSTPSSTPPARVGFARRAHLDWRSTRIWIGGQRAQYQWYGGPTQIGGSHQLRSRAFCRQICRQSQSRPFSPEIGLCRFWIPIATGIRMRQVGKSSEAHIGCGRSAGLSAQVAVEYGGLQPHQRLSNLGMPSASQFIAPPVVDKKKVYSRCISSSSPAWQPLALWIPGMRM